ncbi:MAG: tetratricopeptide repeat protein [Acidobacteriota bacterium]
MRISLIATLAAVVLVTGALPATAGWDEGVAAFTSKNFETAAAEFQTVVDQNPDGFRGHYMLGASLRRLGRKEEAVNHLRKAYDLNPNDLSIQLELGNTYYSLRRHRDVAGLLGKLDASKLPASHRASLYQIRGQSRLKTDNVDGAFSDFQALAKLQPKNADVHFLLGSVALKADRIDSAITSLGNAVRLDGSDVEKKRTYANALIKKGRMSRDKTAKKTSYLKAAELAGEIVAQDASFENLILKVSAELGAGLFDKAAATGERAQKVNPNDWIVPFYIGQAYTSSGKFTQAEPALKKALELVKKPNDQKTIWKQLGFAYEKQKKYADSISAYQNAGDQAGVARVQENQKTAQFNEQVEAENAQIKAMEEEAKRLEDELKKLEGGGGTP